MSPSQCNSTRMIAVLKELFTEHGIPEVIQTDNGPQFASHLFAEFTKDLNIDHIRSSPRNPRSNGQAKSAVKIVKGLLTRAKFSGQDPYLALLAYRSTPVDAHLRSPAEMLYQGAIRTTVPQRIRNKDPQAESDRERLDDRAAQSASYHDRHSRTKSPFYAGQTVSVLNDAKTLWLPATIIRQAAHGSYCKVLFTNYANSLKLVFSSSYAGCFLPCLLVLLFLCVGSLRLFWGMVVRGCARRDLC